MAINESLGLEDGGIEEQLLAIKNKNEELLSLNNELEKTNIELSLSPKFAFVSISSAGFSSYSISSKISINW